MLTSSPSASPYATAAQPSPAASLYAYPSNASSSSSSRAAPTATTTSAATATITATAASSNSTRPFVRPTARTTTPAGSSSPASVRPLATQAVQGSSPPATAAAVAAAAHSQRSPSTSTPASAAAAVSSPSLATISASLPSRATDIPRAAPALGSSPRFVASGQRGTSASVDAGTQYTPPDYPPTSQRSSIRQSHATNPAHVEAVAPPRTITAAAGPSSAETVVATSSAPTSASDPSEPQLRVTPQSTLSSTARAARQRRGSLSESSTGLSSSSAQPSPKRSRADAPLKVMPADYVECDPKDLVALISDMLMELIRYNDEIPLKDGHLTRFHSRAPPGISVHDYLIRLTVHATLPPPILLAMVVYIDKLCALYPTFTINSLTVHRFLITAATVASKGLSDSFWTNNTYARVGGVSVKELALLELELLSRVQWRIVPAPETLVDYYRNLVQRSDAHDFAVSSSSEGDSNAMDIEVPKTEEG